MSAIGLNIEGSRCISQINSLVENDISSSSASSNDNAGRDSLNNNNNNQLFSNRGDSEDNSTTLTQEEEEEEEEEQKALRESFELRRYCFVVTNLYVYSLFGVTIGVVILAFWYIKYKKIWSRKTNSLDK